MLESLIEREIKEEDTSQRNCEDDFQEAETKFFKGLDESSIFNVPPSREKQKVIYLPPFDSMENVIFNLRDLNHSSLDPQSSGPILSGKLFRSASLTRSPLTVDQAESAIQFFKNTLKVQTIIDLRSKNDILDSPVEEIIRREYPILKLSDFNSTRKKKLMIPIISFAVQFRGFFWPSPRQTKIKMIEAAWSGRRKGSDEPMLKRIAKCFVREVFNTMGLVGMNKCILEYGHWYILQLFKTLSVKSNYPILIHCSSGKDRTGLIVALVMACCGISDEIIFENYSLSDHFLSPILDLIIEENRSVGMLEGFDSTPKFVMEQTFDYIRQRWDSVQNYLLYINFSLEEQQQLRTLLLKEQ